MPHTNVALGESTPLSFGSSWGLLYRGHADQNTRRALTVTATRLGYAAKRGSHAHRLAVMDRNENLRRRRPTVLGGRTESQRQFVQAFPTSNMMVLTVQGPVSNLALAQAHIAMLERDPQPVERFREVTVGELVDEIRVRGGKANNHDAKHKLLTKLADLLADEIVDQEQQVAAIHHGSVVMRRRKNRHGQALDALEAAGAKGTLTMLRADALGIDDKDALFVLADGDNLTEDLWQWAEARVLNGFRPTWF